MLEALVMNAGVKAPSSRSVRLIARSSASRNALGVYELELYDKTGNNLCRTPGYIPTTSYSPEAANNVNVDIITYGPGKAIDGIYNAWTSTCYMSCNPNNTAWIQFDFPQDIVIDNWRILFEGAYYPIALDAVALQINIDGNWHYLTGTRTPSPWGLYTWTTFTDLKIT